MDEIKIESFQVLQGEIGLEPKDHLVWLYKALDTKTQRYLIVVVDTTEKPDKKTEEVIYKHILATFKRAEKGTK